MSVCKTEHQAFPPPHTFGILVQIDSECNIAPLKWCCHASPFMHGLTCSAFTFLDGMNSSVQTNKQTRENVTGNL